MGEAPQTIAVAGTTPFALVLAGLLAADHGRKVYVVGDMPSAHDVPPPPSFSIAPATRPETLHLALTHGPDTLRRIAKVAPEAVERTDLMVRATTAYHATALSHFRHLAVGFGQVVEREEFGDGEGTILRIRDVTRLSPGAFAGYVREWAGRIGIEWIEDSGALSVRRNGAALLGGEPVDRLVLADDAAIVALLETGAVERIGRVRDHFAYITERGHGVADPAVSLPHGTFLDPQRDGTLAIHADNWDGLADARIAAALQGLTARKAARRSYGYLRTHDGAPVVGVPARGRAYIAAGLGALDVALAPVIARHIVGAAHGFEAEWCGQRAPGREMIGSAVGEIAAGAAP